MKIIFVVAFLVIAVDRKTEGLKCLRCNEVYNPILCNYITTCSKGEICSIEKVRNENGYIRYNLGCKSTTTCADYRNLTDPTFQTRAASPSTYTTICHDCCQQDNLCNSAGCGETGYPVDIGPVCLNCENIDNPYECDKIRACEQDEVCYIEENVLFHMKLFTTKCVQKHVCDPTNGNIFGRKKRNADLRLKRSPELCSKCCTGKLCNDICGTDYGMSTTTSSPGSANTFSIQFTTCGKIGPFGPTLLLCKAAYNYTEWSMNTTMFNVVSGIQEWLVPETGYYIISAYGAAGGDGNTFSDSLNQSIGGNGAEVQGKFYLTASTVLNIVVGQKGGDGASSYSAGGGGGSFVYTGLIGGSGLLIAAGGGGGGGEEDTHPGYNGLGGKRSQNGLGIVNNTGITYGDIGYGGKGGYLTLAGAGWRSDGGSHLGSETGYPGKRWIGGDTGSSSTGSGGFGGGGSGCSSNGGGGGGGYTGASSVSSSNRTLWGGGGAGSFNSGTNQINLDGVNSGDGYVIITKL